MLKQKVEKRASENKIEDCEMIRRYFARNKSFAKSKMLDRPGCLMEKASPLSDNEIILIRCID